MRCYVCVLAVVCAFGIGCPESHAGADPDGNTESIACDLLGAQYIRHYEDDDWDLRRLSKGEVIPCLHAVVVEEGGYAFISLNDRRRIRMLEIDGVQVSSPHRLVSGERRFVMDCPTLPSAEHHQYAHCGGVAEAAYAAWITREPVKATKEYPFTSRPESGALGPESGGCGREPAFGIWYQRDEKIRLPHVRLVASGSCAEAAGLQVDDLILEVNGQVPLRDLCELLMAAPCEMLEITVDRGGTIKRLWQ
jgi:hypothetical protein